MHKILKQKFIKDKIKYMDKASTKDTILHLVF